MLLCFLTDVPWASITCLFFSLLIGTIWLSWLLYVLVCDSKQVQVASESKVREGNRFLWLVLRPTKSGSNFGTLGRTVALTQSFGRYVCGFKWSASCNYIPIEIQGEGSGNHLLRRNQLHMILWSTKSSAWPPAIQIYTVQKAVPNHHRICRKSIAFEPSIVDWKTRVWKMASTTAGSFCTQQIFDK